MTSRKTKKTKNRMSSNRKLIGAYTPATIHSTTTTLVGLCSTITVSVLFMVSSLSGISGRRSLRNLRPVTPLKLILSQAFSRSSHCLIPYGNRAYSSFSIIQPPYLLRQDFFCVVGLADVFLPVHGKTQPSLQGLAVLSRALTPSHNPFSPVHGSSLQNTCQSWAEYNPLVVLTQGGLYATIGMLRCKRIERKVMDKVLVMNKRTRDLLGQTLWFIYVLLPLVYSLLKVSLH